MASPIILNGVELNGSMEWIDRHKVRPVGQSVKRLLGGAAVVRSTKLIGLRNVTLEATEDHGWLTLAVVQQIEAMADVAGATYNLTIDSVTYSVIFRHEESPAVDLSPLLPRIQEQSGDYYIGTIKLAIV